MPWTDGTLVADDVALHVGAMVDERMVRDTDTVRAFAQRYRQHTDPQILWSDPVFHDGAVRYAGLIWRTKAAPVGFASFEPQSPEDYTEYARAMSHLGAPDPVIA